MKLKERLVMVTLGFSIAIALFLFNELFFVDSSTLENESFTDQKVSGNRFHGQIHGNPKKKVVNDDAGQNPINFQQRNLQKMASGSNAASGTGENTDPTNGPLEKHLSTRFVLIIWIPPLQLKNMTFCKFILI